MAKTRAELNERARRRKLNEARKSRGENVQNWPTRARGGSSIAVTNVADLSPAERARYGL